jgi:hypothetical protein
MSINDTIEAINELPDTTDILTVGAVDIADLKELAAAYTELLEAAKQSVNECLPAYEAKEPLERLKKAIQN